MFYLGAICLLFAYFLAHVCGEYRWPAGIFLAKASFQRSPAGLRLNSLSLVAGGCASYFVAQVLQNKKLRPSPGWLK